MDLLNCPKCGLQVNSEDKFCRKCGTSLESQPPTQQRSLFNFIYPLNSQANMVNGVFIGAGAVMIILGLYMAFVFNADYFDQLSKLTAQIAITGPYMLYYIIDRVALGVFIVALGTFTMISGLLQQFSQKARASMNGKGLTARVGNRLISAGFIIAALSSTSIVHNFYVPDTSPYFIIEQLFIVGGTSAIVIGILLIIGSYLKSRKLTTKV